MKEGIETMMHKDFYSGLKLLLHFPLLSTSFRKAHLHMVYIAQLVRLQTKASLALLLIEASTTPNTVRGLY